MIEFTNDSQVHNAVGIITKAAPGVESRACPERHRTLLRGGSRHRLRRKRFAGIQRDRPFAALRVTVVLCANERQFAVKVALIAIVASFAIVAALHGQQGVSANQSVPAIQAGTIEGTVIDSSGSPIQGARITDGSVLAITGADGVFSLERATLDPDEDLRIGAPGYADWSAPVPQLGAQIAVSLDLRPIQALYLNPTVTTSDAQVDNLIQIINTTNANAVVIDIKEEWVWYDSQVAFFRDAGTVQPAFDIASLLWEFHDNDIYTIARLVVFKDSTVATAYPHLAITDINTGGPRRLA